MAETARHEPPALAAWPPLPEAPPAVRRVLVIEDNRDAAESLRVLLEVAGHEVPVAYTGPDGVRQVDEWRPDVVPCDIGLPGLDGSSVAADLRRRSVTATARLIAVTGYGSEEDKVRASDAGFDHHLTKPADQGSCSGCSPAGSTAGAAAGSSPGTVRAAGG